MTWGMVTGIDPGFANMGMVTLSDDDSGNGTPEVVHWELVKTEKGGKKELAVTRVSADDLRRVNYLWDRLVGFLAKYPPRFVGVEVYVPFQRQGGGAWKSAMGYGIALAACRSRGVQAQPFLPSDIRRGLNLVKSATKTDVEDMICLKVKGGREMLDTVAKTHREHLADALAHAYLAAIERRRLASLFGGDYAADKS